MLMQEIKTFIFSQNVDILFLKHTLQIRATAVSLDTHLDTLYHTIHPDGKAYGGSALIIRSNIEYYEIDKFQRKFLQATNIMVDDGNDCIIISATYLSPKHIIKNNI